MDLPATYGSSPALLVDGSSHSSGGSNSTLPTSDIEVHPLVLLSVLDHHTRRPEGAGRVIGTLLGSKVGGSVEITNCFAVPHAERGDEVAIGKDFNRQMLALHLRANRKERVVGWYATALPDERTDGDDNGASPNFKCVADTSSLIHEFYAGECEEHDPVHVVLDTSLANGDCVALKAYRSTPVQIKGEPLANLFHEIRLGVKATDGEKICVDHMIRQQEREDHTGLTTLTTNHDSDDSTAQLQRSMAKLYDMLEQASDYVDGVVDGTVAAPSSADKIGRRLADTLSSIPKIRPDVFDKMFNDSLQDLLMVTYLSNITRTQLTIAEKLNAALNV